jgi:hypothetical protein
MPASRGKICGGKHQAGYEHGRQTKAGEASFKSGIHRGWLRENIAADEGRGQPSSISRFTVAGCDAKQPSKLPLVPGIGIVVRKNRKKNRSRFREQVAIPLVVAADRP